MTRITSFAVAAVALLSVASASAQTDWLVAGVPLPFIETRGVHAAPVRYHTRAAGRTILFAPGCVRVRFDGAPEAASLVVRFGDANAPVVPIGERRTRGIVSYFTGPRERWRTGLPTFERVRYRAVWPGIDVVYRMDDGRLEYDVEIAPGADPAQVRLVYSGLDSVTSTDDGGLRFATPAGSIHEEPPVAYQRDADRTVIAVRFEHAWDPRACRATVSFDVGEYDGTKPLVIDPLVLVYSGYVGGTGAHDSINDIAVDAKGFAYITGATSCTETTFPVAVGPDLTHNGILSQYGWAWDAYVAKVDRTGNRLIYCGFIGGLGWEEGNGIAVDASGAAYVGGWTGSLETNFPVTVGPGLKLSGGAGADAFVAKVSPDGTRLVYCGYIGGSTPGPLQFVIDRIKDIAVDGAGAAYVVGDTDSDERTFPVLVGPFTRDPAPDREVFVAKVKPDGSGLDYCGYIGGVGRDEGTAIAIDPSGAAYVAGIAQSNETSFPVRVGPDLTFNSVQLRGVDGFVAKVRPDGSGLVYCGYVGGDWGAFLNGIAVDHVGRAHVAGDTLSTEATFPVVSGPDLTHNSPGVGGDGFVGRLRADGTGFEYLGYIGGLGTDTAADLAVDAGGRVILVGGTTSPDYPLVAPLYNTITPPGWSDGIVARLDSRGSSFDFSTFFGGAENDGIGHVAIDRLGNQIYFAHRTTSDERSFPVKVGPDLTFNDPPKTWPDGFVAKIITTELVLSGSSRIGSTMTLDLMDERGLPYQVASSLTIGPTMIGSRRAAVGVDPLFVLSVTGAVPRMFAGYSGALDANGRARASIRLPNERALIGVDVHTLFVTFKPGAPQGVQSVSNPVRFRVR